MQRLVGSTLLVIGCAAWAFLVSLKPAVDAAATAVDGGSGEIQLMVLDLRLPALLVVAAGVAVLAAPRSLFVSRSYGALLLTSAVLIVASGLLGLAAANGLSPAAAGEAMIGVAIAMGAASQWIVSRPPSAEYAEHAGRDVPRRFLLGVACVVAAGIPAISYFMIDDWSRSAVPARYEIAVPASQILLAAAAVTIIVVAVRSTDHPLARGVGWVVASACMGVVALTGWVLTMPMPTPWPGLLILWGCLVALPALVASASDPDATVRHVVIRTAVAAVTLPLVFIPAICAGLTVGIIALSLTGGEMGADGLPIFAIGPMLAMVSCIVCSGVTPLLPRAERRGAVASAPASLV